MVRGHSRSSAMSPFDGAHTTSHSTLIYVLTCTVYELFVESRWLSPTHLRLASPLGWPRWNFAEICGVRKLEYLDYCVTLLAWFYVWTDSRTRGHSIYRAIKARHVNKKLSYRQGTAPRAVSVETVRLRNVAQMFVELHLISSATSEWHSRSFKVTVGDDINR